MSEGNSGMAPNTAVLQTDWPNFCGMGSDVVSSDLFNADFFGDDIVLNDSQANQSSHPPPSSGTNAVTTGSNPTKKATQRVNSNIDISALFTTNFLESVGSADNDNTRLNSLQNLALLGMVVGDGMGSFRPSTSFNDFNPIVAAHPATVYSSDPSVAQDAIAGASEGKKRPLPSTGKKTASNSEKAKPAVNGPATRAADKACNEASLIEMANEMAKRPTKRMRKGTAEISTMLNDSLRSSRPEQIMSANPILALNKNGNVGLHSRQSQVQVGKLEDGFTRSVSTPNPLADSSAPKSNISSEPSVEIPMPNLEAYRKAIEGAAATAAAIAVTSKVSSAASIKSLVRSMPSLATTNSKLASSKILSGIDKTFSKINPPVANQMVKNNQKNGTGKNGLTSPLSKTSSGNDETKISDTIGTAVSSDSKIDSEHGPNTSTAHVTALTSSNWAKVSTAIEAIPKKEDNLANKDSKQNLSAEDRAKQNRDRNREHARNTRLRKKAYVEELKRTLTEMVAQRDAFDRDRIMSARRVTEQRDIRFAVMEEFMKYRGQNESSIARWCTILEPTFALVRPVTAYRKLANSNKVDAVTPRISSRGIHHNVRVPPIIPEVDTASKRKHFVDHKTQEKGFKTGGKSVRFPAEVRESAKMFSLEQKLHGAADMVIDANSIASFLQSIGKGTTAWKAVMALQAVERVTPFVRHTLDKSSFVSMDNTAIVNWTATTVGLKKQV